MHPSDISGQPALTFRDKLRTARKLTWLSIARVMLYRLGLRVGYWKRTMPLASSYSDELLPEQPCTTGDLVVPLALARADKVLAGHQLYFGHLWERFDHPRRWQFDPIHGVEMVGVQSPTHWTDFNELGLAGTDIKIIWEPARFECLLWLAVAARQTGDRKYLSGANAIIQDWLRHNPANSAPHWRCAQETGIRLLHLLLARWIVADDIRSSQIAYVRFVREHTLRILPTMGYAVGQDNNHAITEAVALMLAARVLHNQEPDLAKRAHQSGVRVLTERLARLVDSDGCFSQVSTVYHRMVLDLLNLLQMLGGEAQPFSMAAIRLAFWLEQHIAPGTRDAINLGPNDGTHVGNVLALNYRDFRSSVELAGYLWSGATLPDDSPWQAFRPRLRQPSTRLSGSPEASPAPVVPTLRSANLLVTMRTPRCRFRPAQSDFLHVDLWWRGQPLCMDSGSYAYNLRGAQLNLEKASAHNVVEGALPIMRKVGHFLYADWPDGHVQLTSNSMYAEFETWAGERFSRCVTLHSDRYITVEDSWQCCGPAVLRWHTDPQWNWQLDRRGEVRGSGVAVAVLVNDSPVDLGLGQGADSRFYLGKAVHPVITVPLPQAGRAKTEFRLQL